MTDPLLRIEAVIEELGSRQAGFWTPLDTSQAQVSSAKPLENRGFGHFGRFGHPRESTLADGLIEGDTQGADSDAETQRTSRASSLIYGGVQSVQSVQNDEKGQQDQLVGFGHLEAASVQNRASGVQKSAGEPLDWQRAARIPASGHVPVDWTVGVALLRQASAPHGYPQHAWRQLILDAARFVDDWAAQAAVLGWPAWELFGCHRRAPWGRIQGMGLVLLLKGNEIAALTATEAVIRTGTGARQTYRRKPADPLLPAERCLVWELQNA
jgi:hypothetical protein